ncbi:MAG: hypothetical protein J5802_03890 [Butyrivibrio sp.]|nr:hypothetical protein [Butyrivibrio sp.]
MRVERKMDVPISTFQKRDGSTDASNSQNIGVNSASGKNKKAGKSGNNNNPSVSGTNLTGESLVAQRRGIAQKQALRVVADAFKSESKIDTQMQQLLDEIHMYQDEISAREERLEINNKKLEELQKKYNVDPNSEEHKLLSQLEDVQGSTGYLKGKSEEDAAVPITEYQKEAYLYVKSNEELNDEINDFKDAIYKSRLNYTEIKKAREKTHNMIDAQKASEDIMESANKEAVVLLTDEAVSHLDEAQKEREKEAKEQAEEKKEAKKEKAEKLEREARQQEMIENIKERAELGEKTTADIKRASARKERMEAVEFDVPEDRKQVIADTANLDESQGDVQSEITNILNGLKLLSDDIKGVTVDRQL